MRCVLAWPSCGLLSALQPPDRRTRLRHGGGSDRRGLGAHGDRDAAERAVSDALIDATSIAGTPQHCRERVEAYRRSGIDLPILSPFARGPGAKAKFDTAIRACAP
jgi:alkanesulfonate monooxygenase SsuD/methylene tetrahydromethanopterin reductase-like flavin-dependent oxidoreductase (luciferase family)